MRRRPILTSLSFALLLLTASAGAARAYERPPRISLLLMTRGPELFARFGHSAILVEQGGRKTVYNFGYTRFDSGLIWRFLRGRARFWVETNTLRRCVLLYKSEGRGVVRVPVRLDAAAAYAVARALDEVRKPANRYYIYHHFQNNCASRVRDVLDDVLGGRVSRPLRGGRVGTTYRERAREGFADDVLMLLVAELILGREGDRQLDAWADGFLPDQLMTHLGAVRDRAGRPLLGAPQVLVVRRIPRPGLGRTPYLGVYLIVGFGLLTALLTPLALHLRRRRRRWAGLLLLLPPLVLGLLGLVLWLLAALSSVPWLCRNELALVLWPTDLALLGVAVRWMRGRFAAGRWLRGYLALRCGVLALVGLGHAVGLLTQQPRVTILAAAALLLPLWVELRADPGGETPSPGDRSGADSRQ